MTDAPSMPTASPEVTTSTPTPSTPTPAPAISTTPVAEAPLAPPAPAPSIVSAPAPAAPLDASSFTLAEGETLHESFLSILNNAELTPQQRGQSLLDLHAQLTREASEAGSRNREAEQQEWQRQVETDPVIGGANLTQTLTQVGRVMDMFAPATTPEGIAIRQAFDVTGAGNHPEIVRFLSALGSQFREATPPPNGQPTTSGSTSTAQLMYGGTQ